MEGRRGPWTLLLGSLTADVAALSFAVPWALMFVLLVLRRWIAAPTARFAVGLTAALFGIGAAMSGVVFAGKLVGEHRAREGIVVVEEARVFGGPDERFQVSFTETEGERVRVIGREGRYLQVRTRDGREGWVLREDVDRL